MHAAFESKFLLMGDGDHSATLFKTSKVAEGKYTDLSLPEILPENYCDPVPVTFIGRSIETQLIFEYMVRRCRCILVEGAYGIGKTTCALSAIDFAMNRGEFQFACMLRLGNLAGGLASDDFYRLLADACDQPNITGFDDFVRYIGSRRAVVLLDGVSSDVLT